MNYLGLLLKGLFLINGCIEICCHSHRLEMFMHILPIYNFETKYMKHMTFKFSYIIDLVSNEVVQMKLLDENTIAFNI